MQLGTGLNFPDFFYSAPRGFVTAETWPLESHQICETSVQKTGKNEALDRTKT